MTHTELIAKVGGAIRAKFEPDPRALEALEEALLTADVGPQTAAELVAAVKEEAGRRDAGEADVVRRVLKAEIARRLTVPGPPIPAGTPHVIFMVGVNGTGKTTTTAKLASRAVAAGRSVVLAAADTFRAAAVEQLEIWADRLGVPLVKHKAGADPAAVVHDACAAAVARKADLLSSTRPAVSTRSTTSWRSSRRCVASRRGSSPRRRTRCSSSWTPSRG